MWVIAVICSTIKSKFKHGSNIGNDTIPVTVVDIELGEYGVNISTTNLNVTTTLYASDVKPRSIVNLKYKREGLKTDITNYAKVQAISLCGIPYIDTVDLFAIYGVKLTISKSSPKAIINVFPIVIEDEKDADDLYRFMVNNNISEMTFLGGIVGKKRIETDNIIIEWPYDKLNVKIAGIDVFREIYLDHVNVEVKVVSTFNPAYAKIKSKAPST